MTKKLRVTLAVATVEVMLGGLWFNFAATARPDAQATIGSTMGMAMGAFLGFGVLMMFIAAKNDRAASGRRG